MHKALRLVTKKRKNDACIAYNTSNRKLETPAKRS